MDIRAACDDIRQKYYGSALIAKDPNREMETALNLVGEDHPCSKDSDQSVLSNRSARKRTEFLSTVNFAGSSSTNAKEN